MIINILAKLNNKINGNKYFIIILLYYNSQISFYSSISKGIATASVCEVI
jgi:hypothetical protein